jgi:LysR family glycine cleavage system transcriptional activator
MHQVPLNGLRAFEAAARHLSLTRAAEELNVSPGAVSHQIRSLEGLLGVPLFERRVRAIALTPAGKLLYPGVQAGFLHIREAVAELQHAGNNRVLVVSTAPGLTSKWLAPRLYRFTNEHPEIEVRISSSINNANFNTDGVDIAVRNLAVDPDPDPALVSEKLVEITFVPVCSPRLVKTHGPLGTPQAVAHAPLIHDDSLVNRAAAPEWGNWFKAARIAGVDITRGLRFNSADHALDAASEGAGVLLTHDLFAYDDLRTGRLIIAAELALPSRRALYLVYPKRRRNVPRVQAFCHWIKREVAALDWTSLRTKKGRSQSANQARRAGR